MNVLLKSVRIIHPDGRIDKNRNDILIIDGVIQKIGEKVNPPAGCQVFESEGSYVSVGWIDMKANFRDPGAETMEGIPNGLKAAAAGGFTGVVLMPSTQPPVQDKAAIEYLVNRSNGNAVTIYPTGCLSENRDGTNITEMYDMKLAGAVAFTDDRRPVSDSGLLMRALLYARNIDSLVISYPDDKNISGKSQVNESTNSTVAGMKGIPAFSEELSIHRDLRIAEYTGGRIHFSTLSAAASVELIREAKRKGLPVTAEVCAHQLFFDDSVITDYDTNFKVKPPFRGKSDVEALIQGVKDGTIDVICSDHQPQDPESKVTEFEFAAYGISGIETAFSAAMTALNGKADLTRIIDAMTVKPRQILGLTIPEIKEGATAELTIFNPDADRVPSADQFRSRCLNNPFIGMQLKGKVLGIFNNGKFVAN